MFLTAFFIGLSIVCHKMMDNEVSKSFVWGNTFLISGN